MAKKKTIKERVRVIGIAETLAVVNPIKWDNENGKYVQSDDGKYSINLCIDKNSPSAKKLKKSFDTIVNETGFELKLGEENKRFKSCVRDGDDKSQFIEYKDVYTNCWIVSLKNKFKPTIYDMDGDRFDINDSDLINEQLYRGVTVTTIADLYALTENVNKGIFGSLSGLKVLKLTDRLNSDTTVDSEEFELDEEEEAYFIDPDF